MIIRTLTIVISLFAATSLCSKEFPNIVLIFADDLGYGDVGCYGATKVQTPNIDKLASDGRRFTDAHSASAVCTPSRYALLTGQYPCTANDGRGIWGPCHPNRSLIIDTDQLTIAKVLKNEDYDTSCFGKWHLGFGAKETNDWQEPIRPGPQDLGFDYYFGVPVVNSAPPYVYIENDRVFGITADDPLIYYGRNSKNKVTPITPLQTEHGSRVPNWFGGAKEAHKIYNDFSIGTTLTERACQWITDRNDNPFFLYLSTTNIHHPCTPAKQFQGTSQCGLYGDFIHELDWMVGEVMKTLETKGVADNTLVIFTSDNGGMFNENGQDAFKYGHQINGKLLGFKFGAWEGGHRVPFIARWPGKIEAGTTSDQLVCNIDMLATFASLSGQVLQEDVRADSVDILPALVGNPEKPVRDQLVLAPVRPSHLSLRRGKWMFIDARNEGGFGGVKPGGHGFAGAAAANFVGKSNSDISEVGKMKAEAPAAQLYDLENDVYQTQNLYNDYPEIAHEMRTILNTYKSKRKSKPAIAGTGLTRNAAPKIPAKPSKQSVCLDFESGKLTPWKVVDGEFAHLIGNREFFFTGAEFNKQGKHYLTTLETSATEDTRTDVQTGVVISPLFIAKPGTMTFRIGGGGGTKTYIALCSEDGAEMLKASGAGGHLMQKAAFDITPYADKKIFLKIVDQSKGSWGHITVDHIEFDGEVLPDYAK